MLVRIDGYFHDEYASKFVDCYDAMRYESLYEAWTAPPPGGLLRIKRGSIGIVIEKFDEYSIIQVDAQLLYVPFSYIQEV
mgnify:CR=1 FL=1